MAELSWREAILEVLGLSADPMHYTDIAEAIAEQGLKTEFGATPAASVAAMISISRRDEGDASPFVRVSRGYYTLRARIEELEGEELADEGEEEQATGLINAFGMYWRRDLVLWETSPRLLGRQQAGSIEVDFGGQTGVYLLHDGSKVVYVGRASDRSLARRLRGHTTDRLNGRWDRFSWFGVYDVAEDGTLNPDDPKDFTLDNLVATMEALLIEGLEPPQNRKRGDDFRAVEFLQVVDPKIENAKILELMDQLKDQLKE